MVWCGVVCVGAIQGDVSLNGKKEVNIGNTRIVGKAQDLKLQAGMNTQTLTPTLPTGQGTFSGKVVTPGTSALS